MSKNSPIENERFQENHLTFKGLLVDLVDENREDYENLDFNTLTFDPHSIDHTLFDDLAKQESDQRTWEKRKKMFLTASAAAAIGIAVIVAAHSLFTYATPNPEKILFQPFDNATQYPSAHISDVKIALQTIETAHTRDGRDLTNFTDSLNEQFSQPLFNLSSSLNSSGNHKVTILPGYDQFTPLATSETTDITSFNLCNSTYQCKASDLPRVDPLNPHGISVAKHSEMITRNISHLPTTTKFTLPAHLSDSPYSNPGSALIPYEGLPKNEGSSDPVTSGTQADTHFQWNPLPNRKRTTAHRSNDFAYPAFIALCYIFYKIFKPKQSVASTQRLSEVNDKDVRTNRSNLVTFTNPHENKGQYASSVLPNPTTSQNLSKEDAASTVPIPELSAFPQTPHPKKISKKDSPHGKESTDLTTHATNLNRIQKEVQSCKCPQEAVQRSNDRPKTKPAFLQEIKARNKETARTTEQQPIQGSLTVNRTTPLKADTLPLTQETLQAKPSSSQRRRYRRKTLEQSTNRPPYPTSTKQDNPRINQNLLASLARSTNRKTLRKAQDNPPRQLPDTPTTHIQTLVNERRTAVGSDSPAETGDPSSISIKGCLFSPNTPSSPVDRLDFDKDASQSIFPQLQVLAGKISEDNENIDFTEITTLLADLKNNPIEAQNNVKTLTLNDIKKYSETCERVLKEINTNSSVTRLYSHSVSHFKILLQNLESLTKTNQEFQEAANKSQPNKFGNESKTQQDGKNCKRFYDIILNFLTEYPSLHENIKKTSQQTGLSSPGNLITRALDRTANALTYVTIVDNTSSLQSPEWTP